MGAGEPLRFGGRFTDIEALMWRLGTIRAELAPTMTLVAGLDGALPAGALSARVARVVSAVPRLGERIRPPAVAGVAPVWEPDPSFSLDDHIEVAVGADPLDLAAQVVANGFPDSSPPWRGLQVRAPGGDAVVLHLHHSYTDGIGGIRLVTELFDFEPTALDEASPSGPAGPEASSGAGVAEDLGDLARTAELAASALPWARRLLSAAWNEPSALLAGAANAALDCGATAAFAATPPSRVLEGRSAGVDLRSVSVPLESLRSFGRRLGATINDVFLAALLEALGDYHDKHGNRPAALRLGMPLNTRPDTDAGMHNQVHAAVMRAPLARMDLDERVRLVHETAAVARTQPWLALTDRLAAIGLRLPGVAALAARSMTGLDVLASNVPGPPVPMYLGGLPVTSMVPFGPRSGAAVNATLLSYAGTATVGLNLDPASVDADVLVDCLQRVLEGI